VSAERVRPALRTLLAGEDHGSVYVVERDAQMVGYVAVALSYSFEYLGLDTYVDEHETIAFHERRGFWRKTRAAMTRWLVAAPEDGT